MLQYPLMADDKFQVPSPPNGWLSPEEKKSRLRRQVLVQIYLPFTLGLILIGVFAIVVLQLRTGTVSSWADTTVLLLAVPTVVLMTLVLAIVIMLVYGLYKLLSWLPFPLFQVQDRIVQLQSRVRRYSDASARPMIQLGAVAAALGGVIQWVGSLFRFDEDDQDE